MNTTHALPRLLLAAALLAPSAPAQGGAAPSDDAFKYGSPPELAPGTTEEDMWPAATAEGWAQPCLVPWQRSFDDAVLVARTRQQPLLVAVNMDGEIASEHFAGVRYRDPEVAAQMARYACVIASVYRHTPRDYDENGRRIECPRFGTVTCGEHIQCERELYDQYFDGLRVSPRHIVLDLDQQATLDVYYSWDTQTVFTAFTKGVEGWAPPLDPAEPTPKRLVQSADARDRQALEKLYTQSDVATRREILTTLIEDRKVDQLEVLRSALYGLDLELASLARKALAKSETEGALDLMADVLKTPLDKNEREMLLAAVDQRAATSKRASTLATLHSGLSAKSELIDPSELEDLARLYEANAALSAEAVARAETAARSEDPNALLELAESFLQLAQEAPSGAYADLAVEDARRALESATAAGAGGARLDVVRALLAARDGERSKAREFAVAAVEAGALQESDATPLGAASKSVLLRLFAESRQRSIRRAYRRGESWPPEWLSDVSAAYAFLVNDGGVTVDALVEYHDFLRWIGATERASEALNDALARFPNEPLLHDRLRARLLWEAGPTGLEAEYKSRLESQQASSRPPDSTPWFSGYASMVAAEHHRRRGQRTAALAAYDRAIGYYSEHAANAAEDPQEASARADDAAHYVALALAGKARVALEEERLEAATEHLLAALARRPDSAGSPDGLNLTPLQTTKMLLAVLRAAGDAERAASVQAAMDGLDPALLDPPPSEAPALDRSARRGRSSDG